MRLRIVLLATILGGLACQPAARAAFLVVKGRGWGHGIGMGQFGAEGFALRGWSHARILAHYYPRTTLRRVPDRTIRVLIVQGRSRVGIASRRPYRIRDAAGRSWTLPERRILLTPGPHLRLGGRKVALRLPLTIEPGAGPLRVDNRGYRGSLTVVRAGHALSVVDTLSLELYLRGVVGWEMPHRWAPAALAAQAVAARSYALSTLRPGQEFDLFADTRDQVYGGIRAEYASTARAVSETSGQVLLWRGQVARAYYSSTSGGRTQALADALPGVSPVPYLVSVSDPYDSLSPRHRWGPFRFSRARVGSLLHVPRPISVGLTRNASDRVATVVLRWRGGITRIAGREFQRKLDLPSTWFSVQPLSGSRTAPHVHRTIRGRLRGWLVVLQSVPLSDGPTGLRALARKAHARVFRSSDLPGLRPGYYVAAAGPFRSETVARQLAARLELRFPGAYAHRLS